MATLADYVSTVRTLLHDANDALFPYADKVQYINDGLKQRNWVTGGMRTTLTVPTVTTTDTYSFADLGNAGILDIISISVLYGAVRQVLLQRTLTKLNAQFRITTNYRDVPVAYAWVGQSVVLNCIASSNTFTLETDCTLGATAMALPTDEDPLPDMWTDCVPYWAAFRAKLNARRRAEAEEFKQDFFRSAAQIPGARVGMLPSAYGRGRY